MGMATALQAWDGAPTNALNFPAEWARCQCGRTTNLASIWSAPLACSLEVHRIGHRELAAGGRGRGRAHPRPVRRPGDIGDMGGHDPGARAHPRRARTAASKPGGAGPAGTIRGGGPSPHGTPRTEWRGGSASEPCAVRHVPDPGLLQGALHVLDNEFPAWCSFSTSAPESIAPPARVTAHDRRRAGAMRIAALHDAPIVHGRFRPTGGGAPRYLARNR
jgi:hypothetical protein